MPVVQSQRELELNEDGVLVPKKDMQDSSMENDDNEDEVSESTCPLPPPLLWTALAAAALVGMKGTQSGHEHTSMLLAGNFFSVIFVRIQLFFQGHRFVLFMLYICAHFFVASRLLIGDMSMRIDAFRIEDL
jgi:hypothetical protein